MMTHRQRILSVYRGETPDVVPYMLDLSHWYYHKFRQPWDLSRSYPEPEYELIDYHRRINIGFYLVNLGSFYDVAFTNGVTATVNRNDGGQTPIITWTFQTPLGAISRVRHWEESSYSWAIGEHAIRDKQGLEVLAHALSSRTWKPAWDRYRKWVQAVGDHGVVYVTPGYSAMGELLSLWMGIERTMLAAADYPDFLHETVDKINEANLRCIDLIAQSPAEVVLMGDNFSSNIQPPRFFREWSRPYYAEAVRRLHKAGKYVAVHVDGLLRGLLREFAEIGMDCIDAATPAPMGDITPSQCRDEAGPNLILSGGVPPNIWTSDVSDEDFKKSVLDWLDLRRRSPRLIANAGDQPPPGSCEHRFALMRELVEKFGRY